MTRLEITAIVHVAAFAALASWRLHDTRVLGFGGAWILGVVLYTLLSAGFRR